ncbi:hypothetical protein L484_026463 [Morus notabilis]|uniref:UspA domain-containing protein n=1 Tax=Morus notabilis TaxID=981085 RepID=W9QNZ9_9ROSA|nr:hypothetical protein L484_026463 [Morus notabilis]
MGRTGPKLPSFCLNRIRPLVRVRSPQIQSKTTFEAPNSAKNDKKTHDDRDSTGGAEEKAGTGKNDNGGAKLGSAIGRKIMIVVDSSFEAKGALQWALSHTVQSQDKLLLLHVIKSSRQGKGEELSKERAPRAYELVYSLRSMCQSKRPEVGFLGNIVIVTYELSH